MEQKLVSVVVPVYNVSTYIVKCIESLQLQSYKNIEVIIVDDGSEDDSIALAKGIISNDSRFTIYSKDNGGLSDARNYGIDKSTGEFIAFLDSDDYFHIDFLKKMVSKIISDDSDVVICDVELVNERYEFIRFQYNSYTNFITGAHAMLDPTILNMAQNKLYKRFLFDHVRYPVGYYYEDRATTYKLFHRSSRVSFVREPLFFYLQRSNSITKVLTDKKLSDPLLILSELKSYLLINGIFEQYKTKYIQAYLLAIISSSVQIAFFSHHYERDINKYINMIDSKVFTFSNFCCFHHNPGKMISLFVLKINKHIFKKIAIKFKKNQ